MSKMIFTFWSNYSNVTGNIDEMSLFPPDRNSSKAPGNSKGGQWGSGPGPCRYAGVHMGSMTTRTIFSLLCPQHQGQCLALSRCLIKIGRMNT